MLKIEMKTIQQKQSFNLGFCYFYEYLGLFITGNIC